MQIRPAKRQMHLLRWGLNFGIAAAACQAGLLLLNLLEQYGRLNAAVAAFLVVPPFLVVTWMASDLLLRRTLDDADNKAAQLSAFKAGVLTAIILALAVVQNHYKPGQGVGVLAASVGATLLWNTLIDTSFLWFSHRRGPLKRPLQENGKARRVLHSRRFSQGSTRTSKRRIAGAKAENLADRVD